MSLLVILDLISVIFSEIKTKWFPQKANALMKKLDDIDLRILTLLYKDADITNKELAAQIGIAPSTCLERVKRMKNNNVINHAFIDINFKSR